ncbi:NAD(P)/FAD-dependent oxidoreductase [Kocuria sp. cx-455]|uniref:NAD(P)/FAD-dependent oxidoreductase n=1 Tax=unclassified Candidatus Sulfotelmatobacter TaxID=2635724 RepID=UPI001683C1AC|nr:MULTISPECIES: FAD/NAD(P)-binding oxidoreductase [unclassified Candidatus Sulfotelmatobacter]MBD2763215.1 NAD(P)/FAD-dependent oxidoreductase [Kocuria sp. cx-116]MBD2765806.1 NAD(P)/FAD-dependent oxidoreductase [Kocuria sp. cx-455]
MVIQSPQGPPTHARILVAGGGNGGIALAARLHRQGENDVVIVEPRAEHHYRPLLSYVGAGLASIDSARRPQGRVMPAGCVWVRDAIAGVDPEASRVVLASGATIDYDHLVVAAGSGPDWDAIDGSAEALHAQNASTNYLFDLAPKTWRLVEGMRSGTAVFTMPDDSCPCAGASQKILYMACDLWRNRGVLEDIRVVAVVPTDTVFGVPGVDEELERKIDEYGIELRTRSRVRSLHGDTGTAVLDNDGVVEELDYDFLHLTPPHAAPRWVAASGLSSKTARGFVDVDPETLQHRRYPNVWAVGDIAATPGSSSGGALRKQTPVVAKNIRSELNGKAPRARYNGYTVSPFTVSRRTLVFAEFAPDGTPMPSTKLFELRKERALTFLLDRWLLPQIYWHRILRGK